LSKRGLAAISILTEGPNSGEGNAYRLAEKTKNAWVELLENIKQDGKSDKMKFIYFAGKNENKSDENPDTIVLDSLKNLLYLAQAIHETSVTNHSKLKIITTNVQTIGDRINKINLSQSPLWGFAKSLGIEAPNLFDGIVDVDDECLEKVRDLVGEIVSEETEEVCLYNGSKYTARLKSTQRAANKKVKPQKPLQCNRTAPT
jgi:hypothetical protein